MKVADLIRRSKLPAYEVEFILQELLSCPRHELYQKEISPVTHKSFCALEEKRLEGWPIQYLLGVAYFYGMKLKVVPGVFIPRPETEVLVERVLNVLGEGKRQRILDVGSGSGNIALALAKERKWEIDGLDISSLAIAIGTENREDLKQRGELKGQVRFVLGDFSQIEMWSSSQGKYDAIVSNPPYVDFATYDSLPEDVKREPPIALFAGESGLCFYRLILSKAKLVLKQGGYLFLELPGEEEKTEKIKKLAKEFGLSNVEIYSDLTQRDRVLQARIGR